MRPWNLQPRDSRHASIRDLAHRRSRPRSAASAGDIVAPRPDPRPVALVAGLEDGPLKRELAACTDDPVRRTSFSLGHRGAPLHFPEHTRESYVAAAAMGAGIVECDVTFTQRQAARLPARAGRPAHDDGHPADARSLHAVRSRFARRSSTPKASCSRRPRRNAARATSRSPNSARCAARRDGFDPRARTVEELRVGRQSGIRRPRPQHRHPDVARGQHRAVPAAWACRWFRN